MNKAAQIRSSSSQPNTAPPAGLRQKRPACLACQTKNFDVAHPQRRHRATAVRRPPINNADTSEQCPAPNYQELARNGHPIFPASRFNMGASFAQNWRAAALAQCCGEKILRRTLTDLSSEPLACGSRDIGYARRSEIA